MKNTDVDRVPWKKLDDDCAEKINGGMLTITSLNFRSGNNNTGTQKNVTAVDKDRAFVFQLNSFSDM